MQKHEDPPSWFKRLHPKTWNYEWFIRNARINHEKITSSQYIAARSKSVHPIKMNGHPYELMMMKRDALNLLGEDGYKIYKGETYIKESLVNKVRVMSFTHDIKRTRQPQPGCEVIKKCKYGYIVGVKKC
jgi:hypothetical protein